MQVGCVLTAGASQLRYVWHGLFDSILKHSRVSLSLSLDSFSVSLCEKLNMRWNGAETSSLKSEELFHTNIFSVFFSSFWRLCSNFCLPPQSSPRHHLPFLLLSLIHLSAQVIGWIPLSDRTARQQLMVGWTPSDGISVQGEVEKGGMGSTGPH